MKDGDTRTEYDAQVVSFGLVVSYLVDWDAKDENGKSVDVSPDTIRGLLPEVYNAIDDIVRAHVEATRAKRRRQRRHRPTGRPCMLSLAERMDARRGSELAAL